MLTTRIMLLFGGESTEHDVSVASARNVYAALDDKKYDITLCYISKDGHWHLVDDIEALEGKHPLLMPVLGGKHFVTADGGQKIVPEVLLPVLHGGSGENGAVQGLAELLHIPIVGCGVLASAACMDKDITKRLLLQAGLPVADGITCHAHKSAPVFADVAKRLGSPVFIKPARQGSSVGVNKAANAKEFNAALAAAFKHDSKVIIERAIVGHEIECAVLGNERPKASQIGEIQPASDEFYSYSAKYDPESTAKLLIPAKIAPELAARVQKTAKKAYAALECRGLARVDFFVTDEGAIIVNEINTFPGFTNISMYPKLWHASGIEYPELLNKMIELACQK